MNSDLYNEKNVNFIYIIYVYNYVYKEFILYL